jgi:hypothetical protein
LWGFGTTADITYSTVNYAASSARWWASAVGNNEDFLPSLATGSATDTLDDQDGAITAAIEFNGFPLVFKRSAIYILEDNGADVIERRIHGEFGCIGQFAVTKCDNRIYFWSPSNGGELCVFDGAIVRSLTRGVIASSNVGFEANKGFSSGGSFGVVSLFAAPTCIANDGRYVITSQYFIYSAFGHGTHSLIFDTQTGRFGSNFYSYEPFSAVIGYAPQAIWTSANNDNVICMNVVEGGRKGGAIKSGQFPTSTQPTVYSIYREQRGGKKATVNSGKVYFFGNTEIAGSATVESEIPTATSGLSPLATDGRWSGKNLSGQRHKATITVTVPHELTDIEIDVAESASDQSKPRGKF